MHSRPFFTLALLVLLAACSNPLKTGRHLIDAPQTGKQLSDRLGTAELSDVSLPEYAAADEVAFQAADGTVRSGPRALWADKPQRAFTVALARSISDVSGATVIASPWPLTEPPQHKIQVEVEKALASRDGLYRLTGRYYVSDERGNGTSQARSFSIAVPVPAGTTSGVAAAQSTAISQLARQIAELGGPGRSVKTTTPKASSDPYAIPPLYPIDPLPPLNPGS
ncbi:hypothetical protein DRW48_03530 [Paracoccus suum]|uniref:ABC-type transport auxiliary lipoprotein component domain-containing protein n=1 Tax=Paracoccus suum TaxID=2259340 RepID=A0A344PHN4_9RHOB|nr:PqiC family protein [Paracoccus suum]AXC48889.1 hypothetical protein DRW48_03530 [Paracoccus suum]